MLSSREKTLVLWSLCKLSLKEDLSGKLVEELVKVKRELEFKDLAIIFWVMGKMQIRNIPALNELALEVTLRLGDSNFIVKRDEEVPAYVHPSSPAGVDAKNEAKTTTSNKKQKTEDELDFEDMEELLGLEDDIHTKLTTISP